MNPPPPPKDVGGLTTDSFGWAEVVIVIGLNVVAWLLLGWWHS